MLVSLRSPFLDNDKIYPALANLYLKGNLNKEGIRSKVTDEWSNESLETYSHIGVSIMTPQRTLASDFIGAVKKRYPDKIVIAGGPHAKYYTSDLIAEPWDYIVTDDGEKVLPRIIRGEIPLSQRIITEHLTAKEIAELPRPDRLGCKEYLSGFGYQLKGRKSSTLLTARGCPERCHFCEDAMTTVKKTPLEKICMELDDIKELGYEGVYIFDDIFALAPKITEPICRELQKRDLIYRCNGQARMMSEPFMKMLSETGCAEIAFGAESGSQKILDNIEKRTKISQNYDFVTWAHKYGIPVKLFILLGLPGENWETLKETEKFIQHSLPCDVQAAIYYPYKGTQIRDAIDRKQNFVDITFNGEGLGAYGQKGGNTEVTIRTKELSSEDLLSFRNYLVETYRPKSHSAYQMKQRNEEDKFFNERQ